jgi:hypothetical protein
MLNYRYSPMGPPINNQYIRNGHYGIVDITATGGTASVIGLRYTGSVFTTIPGSLR